MENIYKCHRCKNLCKLHEYIEWFHRTQYGEEPGLKLLCKTCKEEVHT